MSAWKGISAFAGIGVLVLQLGQVGTVAADETIGGSVAEAAVGAVADGNADPNCIAGAVANQAIAEGVKKGRKLLGRLGINAAPSAPAAVPCVSADGVQQSQAQARPAPVAQPTAAEPQRRGIFSGLGQRQPRQQQRGQNCGALGAGCMNAMEPLVACMKEVTFWSEMAVAVEHKLNAEPGLSAQDRADMDADIAAMRAAHAANAGRVEPVDPSKPNRHTDWLTPEEYSQAATAASARINSHRQMCNQKHTGF